MKTPTWRGRVMAAGLALAIAVPAGAREPERSMGALDGRITPGTEIDIVDREGRVVRGDFARADDRGVLIAGYAGAEGRLVPASAVVSVTRAGDSLKNGMLIGAGVGLLSAIVVATDDRGDSGCYTDGCKAALGIFLVPAYAGIGALIDRAIKGREVVYRAPADRVSWSVTPHPVPRGAGVRVALEF